MILPIIKYGDPVLKQKGERIDNITPDIKQLATDMIETVRASDGIGLAAPQVGKSLQLFVVDIKQWLLEDNITLYDGLPVCIGLFMPMVFINPEIIIKGDEKSLYNEGCLSFPDVWGFVERPTHIEVKFQDINNRQRSLVCTGLLAGCCQHEFDHCQGEVFIDKMDSNDRKANQEIIDKIEKSTTTQE